MSLDLPLVITGPIGSGKSFVARCFEESGWAVLDADEVGHEVLTESDVIAEISQKLPETLDNGSINRLLLGNRVFSDSQALEALEQITHPRIVQRIDQWLARGPRQKAVEVSVLGVVSARWGSVLVVDSPLATRVERLKARGMTDRSITQRIAAQPGRAAWLAVGDVVLDNEKPGTASAHRLIDFLERSS